MSLPHDEAWCLAKCPGRVWALPQRWQGWVARLVRVFALVAGAMPAHTHRMIFVAWVGVSSVIAVERQASATAA